jgi:hypothetical protein
MQCEKHKELTLNFLSQQLQKNNFFFVATERKFNEDFVGFEIELNLSLLCSACRMTELLQMFLGKCY